jgi:hypothetical protein
MLCEQVVMQAFARKISSPKHQPVFGFHVALIGVLRQLIRDSFVSVNQLNTNNLKKT